MEIRRIASKAIGSMQAIIGSAVVVFALLLFNNFLDIQALLGFPLQNTEMYVMVLVVFGLLSVISGLFLLSQE
jgi:hypothetical protein